MRWSLPKQQGWSADETLTRVHAAIKCGVFDDFKCVLGPKGKKKLVKAALDKLKMEGCCGKGPKVKRNQAWSHEPHADDVVTALNQVQSSTPTEAKKAVKTFFDLNNGELPSTEDHQHLITRDLDLKNERDCTLFSWCQMLLMPRACGSAANWNKAKRECHPCPQVPLKAPKNPTLRPKQRLTPSGSATATPSIGRCSSRLPNCRSTRAGFSACWAPDKPGRRRWNGDGDDDAENGDKPGKDEGNSDDKEGGKEGEKVEAGAVDEASQSFFVFIWHCFVAQLPLF